MWTVSHLKHSHFFVCKLITAATAPAEEQLSGGVGGSGWPRGHPGGAAAPERVQAAMCLPGVSMCFCL